MLMHVHQENVGVDYDSVWTALEANSTSQTGTPEVLLAEAKHNLKEHWNKKLKGGQRGLKGRCSAPGGLCSDEGGVDTDLGAEGDAAQCEW